MPGAGVDHQTGRLVDHYQILVFVDHFELDRLRLEPSDLGRRWSLEQTARSDPVPGTRSGAVDEHSLVDQGTGTGPTQAEQVGQCLVHTVTLQPRRDLELQRVCHA
jgi:hypothetical protein